MFFYSRWVSKLKHCENVRKNEAYLDIVDKERDHREDTNSDVNDVLSMANNSHEALDICFALHVL